MKRVKNRALSMLLLVIIIGVGTLVFLGRLFTDGRDWVAFAANKSIYNNGVLAVGTLYDRNGVVLNTPGGDGNRIYAESAKVRISTLHAVGDAAGNIGTAAMRAFASQLSGYNILDGTYSLSGKGGEVYLSIDSKLNAAAWDALGGRKGVVAVCNYETGEIICMVSSPSFDPSNPPKIEDGSSKYEGVYINRFLSSTYTPGSIYKLITLAAALENTDGLYDMTFSCTGALAVGGDHIVCPRAHGEMKIEDALAVSCNCAFAQLTLSLGADKMEKYAEKYGLTSDHEIDGIKTAAGKYDKAEADSIDLAWSGVGQYNDMVNPSAMLRFVSAVANGGKAAEQTLLSKVKYASGLPADIFSSGDTTRIMKEKTAEAIAAMMNYNVSHNYGSGNFPGLELYAKSGTAEVGGGNSPHAWFVGYINNEDHPLAFVVLVENGGWGSQAAGAVANAVLQAAIKD